MVVLTEDNNYCVVYFCIHVHTTNLFESCNPENRMMFDSLNSSSMLSFRLQRDTVRSCCAPTTIFFYLVHCRGSCRTI